MARRCLLAGASTVFWSSVSLAEDSSPFDIPLSQLNQVNVTSATKTEESENQVAAAIYVISQADISRSGATSIPELLRSVPGLNVARLNSNSWAVTSRGFATDFANKLLVLVDGRSVYNPIFAGVEWDEIVLPMDEIERIEVIRGPGATVWGANAVNGIINIITKKAKDSLGGHVSAGGGSADHAVVNGRYGARIGEAGYARGYLSGISRGNFPSVANEQDYDAWKSAQGGFRYDTQLSSKDSLTVHGDSLTESEKGARTDFVTSSPFTQLVEKDGKIRADNVVGRWEHEDSRQSVFSIQAFAENVQRDVALSHENRETFDLEVQHSFALEEGNKLTWGLGYRYLHALAANAATASIFGDKFIPISRSYDVTNAFVQDEIDLIPNTLKSTVGMKLEYRGYTGIELQPEIRFSYLPTATQTLWTSVSRAIRSPSQVERDINLPLSVTEVKPGLPAFAVLKGDRNAESEAMMAYELGYRYFPTPKMSFDAATFFNHYDHLYLAPPGTPIVSTAPPSPYIEIPLRFDPSASGDVFGIELLANYAPYPWWKLEGWYTYLQMNVDSSFSELTPVHEAYLRSVFTLENKLEIDPNLRFVDSHSGIDAYTQLNLRLGYPLAKGLVVSLVGNDLLDSTHREFNSVSSKPAALIDRSFFAKIDWNF